MNERERAALQNLERRVTALYRNIAPLANYPEEENRFADEDEAVQEARAVLEADSS